MRLHLFHVDAFAPQVFRGNPAAVVPLEAWLPDVTLQAIAAENQLAETAFFIPAGAGADVDYQLRWFTPVVEVDLCGHATLATAHVLYRHLGWTADRVRFSSRSGTLETLRDGDRLALDFPARPGTPSQVSPELIAALGAKPQEVWVARDLMAVLGTEDEVRGLTPDLAGITGLDAFAVIVTAPGAQVDFVSRFFAPRAGIPEDPVTGSSHCTLIPYWAHRLGRRELRALQVSARGGELFCRHVPGSAGDRVSIGGHAVTYLEGTITL